MIFPGVVGGIVMKHAISLVWAARKAAPMLTLAAALLGSLPAHADGLRLPDGSYSAHWQARLQLSGLDMGESSESSHENSRLLGANLLGDYYLTGSGLTGVRGGLRATGGVWLGPRSLVQGNAGLAMGTPGEGLMVMGARSLSLGNPNLDPLDPSVTASYLGIGYTGHAVHSGVSFSADLGLLTNVPTPLRLGYSTGIRLDDSARFWPVLQLGLSYNY